MGTIQGEQLCHLFFFFFYQPGRVAQSVVRLTQEPHTSVPPSADSNSAVVSYLQKYAHEVLINRSGGLSLTRKSVVRLTDRPDMTLDVYRGRKTATTQHYHLFLSTFLGGQGLDMRRNDVASTSFRRHVPTRFLINQYQIITFLILKSDTIENSRIELRRIVLTIPSNQSYIYYYFTLQLGIFAIFYCST